jgi:hypothetical protein
MFGQLAHKRSEATPVSHGDQDGCCLRPWLARYLNPGSMRSAGLAVVVSKPLVVSDQKVIVVNPSHLQIVGIVRVSWAREHPRSEKATPVTDLDRCDVVIDSQWADSPSDDGDAFAIWGVSDRAAYGARMHRPKESCKQDRA